MVLNAGIIAGRSPPRLHGPDEHKALARILKASEMEKQSGVHVVEVISGGRKTMRYQRVSKARVPDEDAKAPQPLLQPRQLGRRHRPPPPVPRPRSQPCAQAQARPPA